MSCPVSLANPDAITCRACSYQGAPDDETRRRLHHAQGVLRQLDASERQLDASQRQRLLSSRVSRIAVLVVAFLFVPPLMGGACLMFGLSLLMEGDESTWGLLASVVWFLMAASPVPALWWWLSRWRRIEDSCSAIPVAGAPGSARCHLCGAEMTMDASARTIVRCAYCSADNLVDRAVLSRTAKRQIAVMTGYEERLRARTVNQQWETRLGVLVVMGAPVLVILAGLAILAVASLFFD